MTAFTYLGNAAPGSLLPEPAIPPPTGMQWVCTHTLATPEPSGAPGVLLFWQAVPSFGPSAPPTGGGGTGTPP